MFKGLWIHFPESAQASSHNFLYGKNARSYGIELESTDLLFAGREFGVVEFGEHRTDSFDCDVKIPHGPDYYDERDHLRRFANSRTTVTVRDNRGHVIFGVITGCEEAHQDDGSDFSFSVQRVHRETWEII